MKNNMKKIINLILALFAFISMQAQDTIFLNGTNTVSFSLKKPVKYYYINCIEYPTRATSRSISNVGTILFKIDGSGTFKPVSTYKSGTWEIYGGNCALNKGTVVLMAKPTVLPPTMNKTFPVTVTSNVSAGVYEGEKLIRTLFNFKTYQPGIYSVTWDGKDDNGVNYVKTSKTKIVVVTNQMTYKWEAKIGNSSTVDYGPNKIKGLSTPYDGVQVGNHLYLTSGFCEGHSPIFKVALNNTGFMIPVRPSQCGDVDLYTDFTTTDGNLIYFSGYDAFDGYWKPRGSMPWDTNSRCQSIIYALKVSDDKDYSFPFPNGKTVKPSLAQCQVYSGIDVSPNSSNRITGLAVMEIGNYLYASHKKIGIVKCFNKTTGALVTTISLGLSDISIEGNYLYGIDGVNVKQYLINPNGTLSYVFTYSNIVNPIGISVKNGLLLVLDAGVSQIKAYPINSSLLWTLGQAGGYLNNPYVANDKFCFTDFSNNALIKGFVIQQNDGSFWVGDAGNCRTLHFNSSRNYLENISYLPMNYCAGVDINNPTRVFASFLEYNATTKSLVANWTGKLTPNYINGNKRQVFNSLLTINGRTYGTIHYYPNTPSEDGRIPELVELTSNGLRFTGIRFSESYLDIIENNGDLIYYDDMYKLGQTSGTAFLMKNPFMGINSSGDMVWGDPEILASIPLSSKDPFFEAWTRPSSKGYIFSNNFKNTGYHLGKIQGSNYIWKTSKSTSTNYFGPFPGADSFDIGNDVWYAGGNVYNIDSFVVWNYIGEGWQGSQVNIWKLFHKDGLMLLKMGKTGPQAELENGKEMAGNAFAGGFVRIGDKYYIFYNDESHQAALGCFEIIGANTIKIYYLTP